jgi:hypothetical protein
MITKNTFKINVCIVLEHLKQDMIIIINDFLKIILFILLLYLIKKSIFCI